MYSTANRYRGLQESDLDLLAILTNTTIDAVLTAHRAELAEWAQEQQLRDHPDLAVLDADLDRIHRRT